MKMHGVSTKGPLTLMYGTVYGDMHMHFSSFNCKGRALDAHPGFLSNATWYLIPKKHSNG